MNATATAYPLTSASPRAREDRAVGEFGLSYTVLMATLAGLLLVSGLTGWICLKSIDRQYALLLTQTAGDLNNLHEIAVHSGAGFADLVELFAAQDSAHRGALMESMQEQRSRNDQLIGGLGQAITESASRKALERVKLARLNFQQESHRFIDAMPEGKTGPGAWDKVVKAFVGYQQSCDELSDKIQRASAESSARVAARVSTLRWLFLGFGVFPFVLAFGLIGLIVYLVWSTPAEVDLE